MRQVHMRAGALGGGVLAFLVALLFLGSTLIPMGTAEAHSWPWSHKHHDRNNNDSAETVTVTIKKYIDGSPATSESADNTAFPMASSWDDPDGIGEGSGTFELSAETSPAYRAVTSEMKAGADYSVEEVLDTDAVGADCSAEHPYALVGYTTGTSMESAASQTPTASAPSLTDLEEDHYVIVWNESCDGEEPDPTPSGDIEGEVTGGSDEEGTGELEVTSIDAEKTTAIANGEFTDGWRYVFNITVPTDEPNLAMKFADWMDTSTSTNHTIAVANNMRISSAQADNGGATILLTAANTYSSPELTMTGDLDAGTDGLQVQVVVEVAVPSDTFNGTYSTSYGVRTLP